MLFSKSVDHSFLFLASAVSPASVVFDNPFNLAPNFGMGSGVTNGLLASITRKLYAG
jgi:hypothetical protein